jgi:hypothetical protein
VKRSFFIDRSITKGKELLSDLQNFIILPIIHLLYNVLHSFIKKLECMVFTLFDILWEVINAVQKFSIIFNQIYSSTFLSEDIVYLSLGQITTLLWCFQINKLSVVLMLLFVIGMEKKMCILAKNESTR